jgi:hypothetical protein
MATHRWTVSSLPLELVTRTVAAARKLREAVASYEPLVGAPVPSNAMIHEIGASTETRVDVICLLNSLLEAPLLTTCFVFSEPAGRAVLAWRSFPLRASLNLDSATDVADVLSILTAHPTSTKCCFWCCATTFSADLQPCGACKAVRYCGKACQTADWRAYHKGKECKSLAAARAKGPEAEAEATKSMLELNRHKTIETHCAARAMFPVPLDTGSGSVGDAVWAGDQLRLTLTELEAGPSGPCIGDSTRGLPTGWFLSCRESHVEEEAMAH